VAFSCGKSFYHLHPGLPLSTVKGSVLRLDNCAFSLNQQEKWYRRNK
jgi:hypothetical protein